MSLRWRRRRTLWSAVLPCLLAVPGSNARAGPGQDYMLYCMGCHGPEAQGVPGKVPPLAHSLGRFLRTAAGRDYVLRVPGAANSALPDERLAAVLNWLTDTYNAAEKPRPMQVFTAAEVARARHKPLPSVLAARKAIVQGLAASGPAPSAHY